MPKPTSDDLFQPSLTRMESKSRTTDQVSRAITEAETAQRERKTARLKAVRLAKEAKEQEKGDGGALRKKSSRAGGRKTKRSGR
ncbi:hypothetical protein [Chelativorans sp. AA-79]|uniref:hypothetical protein n=1 Tax=Chelativorans sp. AA-79 TaxID=3028735 RepID=UPI0023F7B01D|nr:hypothetical protein [Chelativorans sp. AA-79]WEX07100.1 hypothetical protein PVE73_13205 [Chelativorans sp. AA-79]